jgi:hypothetical protein
MLWRRMQPTRRQPSSHDEFTRDGIAGRSGVGRHAGRASADPRGTIGVAKPLLLVNFTPWSIIWSRWLHFDRDDYGGNNAFEWRRSSFLWKLSLGAAFGERDWGGTPPKRGTTVRRGQSDAYTECGLGMWLKMLSLSHAHAHAHAHTHAHTHTHTPNMHARTHAHTHSHTPWCTQTENLTEQLRWKVTLLSIILQV